MGIDRLTPIGENGTLENETSFENWVDNGWTAERLTYDRLNRAFYRGDSKINEMLDNGPKRGMPDSSRTSLLTGIYDGGVSPADSISQIDTGKSTADFRDYALAIIDGVRYLIACDSEEELGLDIINIDEMTYDGVQAISAASLPSPDGDEDWRPYSITCDENYAYIVWNQVSAAAGVNYSDFQIQAYLLSDWTVKSGWSATGTTLHNGGGTPESSQVIHATDTLLAVANYTQTVTASTDPAVYLVDKSDGSISAYGAGDQTSGSGPHKIASNGVYVFTDAGYSIDLSDPTTGCGGTNWPLGIAGNAAGVACIGELVVFSQDNGVTPDPVCYIASVDNSDIGYIDPSAEAVCSGLASVITDGLYFWAYGLKTVGSTVRATLFKIDPYQAMNEDGTTVGAFDEALLTPISFDFSASGHPTTVGWNIPRLVFDGESIWTTLKTTNDGVFRRISRINLR